MWIASPRRGSSSSNPKVYLKYIKYNVMTMWQWQLIHRSRWGREPTVYIADVHDVQRNS